LLCSLAAARALSCGGRTPVSAGVAAAGRSQLYCCYEAT
jgi:hypothetical protein